MFFFVLHLFHSIVDICEIEREKANELEEIVTRSTAQIGISRKSLMNETTKKKGGGGEREKEALHSS